MNNRLLKQKVKEWLATPCPNAIWCLRKVRPDDKYVDILVKCTMNIGKCSYLVSLKVATVDEETAIQEQVIQFNDSLFVIQDDLTAKTAK